MTDFLASILTGAYPPMNNRIITTTDEWVSRYGHSRHYVKHQCPTCEQVWECQAQVCKMPFTTECLICLTRELIEDTERFSKEARQFIGVEVPTDLQGQVGTGPVGTWWRALRSEIDGKLKGLAERAREVLKRQDSEVKG